MSDELIAAAVRPAPVPTTEQVLARRELDRQDALTLPRLRATAERWRNGLAVAGAISFAGGLLAAPGALAAIELEARAIALTAAVIGVASGIVAGYLLLWISAGFPGPVRLSSMAEQLKWTRERISNGRRALWHARWLSLCALIALSVAVFVVIASPKPTAVIVVHDGLTTGCFDTVRQFGDSLVAAAGDDTTVLVGGQHTLSVALKCP